MVPCFIFAAPNPEINYQGKLLDDTGSPVADTTYSITFRLYTTSTGGSHIWTETQDVPIESGLFSVMLGSSTSLASIDFNQELYLGVNVEGDGEMTPRKVLGTVPAAFEAFNSNTLGGVASSSFLRSDVADQMDAFLTLTAGAQTSDLVVTGTATTTNLVVGTDFISDLTGTGLTIIGNALSVSSSSLNISLAGLNDTSIASPGSGQVLSYDGSIWKNNSVSSLGLGNGTFLGLSDTPSSWTTNAIPYVSSNALAFNSNFTYNGTNLVLGGTTGISLGGDVLLSRGAANRLDLASGDSLNLVSGSLRMFGANYLTGNNTSKSVTLGELAGATFTNSTTYNVAIGYQAGRYASTTSAYLNNYMGYQAGQYNTGSDNNFLGSEAGQYNTGSVNNLFGTGAGQNNTGSYNNFFGGLAARDNTGDYNTIFGYEVGMYNTGDRNIIFGDSSGFYNTGSYNNFFGDLVGISNTGSHNTFMGYETGGRMSASSSIAIGSLALRGGSGNVWSGNATTTNNVAIGYGAGYNVLTGGDNNILLGYQAADSLTTGANNIIIGYDVEAPSNTGSNQLNIGNLLFGTGIDGTGTTLSSGNIGIGDSSPEAKLHVLANTGFTGDLFKVSSSTDTKLFSIDNQGNLQINKNSSADTNDLIFSFYDVESAFIRDSNGGNFEFGKGGITALVIENATGNIGIGTTTPLARLSIQKTGVSGNATIGLDQYLETANSVASAAQYGNSLYLKADNTATTTIVGSVIKIQDTTTFGNTVRALEVQSHRGGNVQGENTAISGTGRTFGIRGITEADAGGFFEPAGGYFETRGEDQGNAIRGYSHTITTASLLSLFQASSTFAGTGLEMNFGNTTGSFSSSTSKYLDFQNAGTSVFTVAYTGHTIIGDGTTGSSAGLEIGYGGICVDNDGSCDVSATGTISAVDYETGNSDLAEVYFSSATLEAGEIVSMAGGLSIDRASNADRLPILGVVSTKPGLTLGFDDKPTVSGEKPYPIALAGRVPVILSTENGPVKKGDALMLSSIAGVAMKATATGTVVGIALEDFDATRKYSDTYINQFGDDLVDPIYEPIEASNDPRLHDGCYYSGGHEIGDAPCVPLSATTTEGQVREANEIAATKSVAEQLALLRSKRSETVTLENGDTVKVGRVVMFVDRSNRWFTTEQMIEIEKITALSWSSSIDRDEEDTILSRLTDLARGFVDGVLSLAGLKANKIETSELCVDDVCVTADDLRALLQSENSHSVNTDNENDEINNSNTEDEELTDITDNGNTDEVGESDSPQAMPGSIGDTSTEDDPSLDNTEETTVESVENIDNTSNEEMGSEPPTTEADTATSPETENSDVNVDTNDGNDQLGS